MRISVNCQPLRCSHSILFFSLMYVYNVHLDNSMIKKWWCIFISNLLGTYYTRYVICENYSLKLFFCPLLLKFGICCFVTDLCCNFLHKTKKDSSFNLWFDISLPICLLHFFLTDLICGLKYWAWSSALIIHP